MRSGPFQRIAAAAILAAAMSAVAPAPAGAAHDTRIKAVTSGNARFQVLSPTLIRTEYAGGGKFADAPTFNAVGRDAFAPASFTSSTSNGWLTIRTSALTLRYQVGSGPFTTRNLSVSLRTTTAAPWQQLTCSAGALCEAEDLSYSGLAVATDHAGFTGAGFLAGFEGTGNSLAADVEVTAAGAYQFALRYANAVGGDGQHTTRTLSLSVDGGAARTVTLPATANWDTWALTTPALQLAAGRHTIALTRTAADSGNVNIDSVALLQPGAAYPPTSARATVDCAYGVSCEAEAGRPAGTAKVAEDHAGYAGRGFVAELNQGAGVAARLVNVPADGTYTLHVRYANGVGGDGLHQTRTATVTAGSTTGQLSFPTTADWDTWETASLPVTLKAGANDIALSCPSACRVNPDTLAVTAAGASAPPPHLPLGGYRRSLDNVNGDNGAPPTTPGLLHKDGWYLLDDTPSALYDPATRTVTQRPAQRPYQDGYFFGFGRDHKRALADLATLTGPPALLPQWAYGVWYSEYIDRTAADYQNTILPRFRSEGVPLDVLVTDTDFKSPNTWSGWQIDRAKFPDPKAFFDWSASQGLHNTLNTHPSIVADDPQFAQAQATAKGKLRRGGCAGAAGPDCHTFDWGDPDQLKAYMDLHKTMDQQGNDFWWLDWCCDASQSSLPGVTPDAWINQQYAAANGGFVMSRAYGSLQTGSYAGRSGLPTGPWADKRTTLHFTGDTSSTWGTLRVEVGSTPAESAATGMAAISHDIGGHNDTTGLPGSETYLANGQTRRTTKLPDDLYARWVQFGTFQPIDRLHSNHGDRLPWQYGSAAKESAKKFLNLRESLVPYTYTLAKEANATGVPIVRPTYLEYPEEEAAYAAAATQYFYGPDLLVAPVTTPGATATTSVWFPPGQWTDYFTGQTYSGGTTRSITTGLDTMPVFVRAGGIVPTRTAKDTMTVSIAAGASGSVALHDRTRIRYTESGGRHTVKITGRPTGHRWTLSLRNAEPPTDLPANAYRYDSATRTLTVTLPRRDPVTFTYR
ncbi:TIM-barrel domain-containing protein [Nonomuraea angiospora]|uniref:Alpha-glucosidase (Family GH31 glycosyl hydrolase) n=1 Tax=Nonomuraea angiospora TaxID=46172 RepID=A0ABR9LNB8_9ACTN|nr:TIM-barrel domain-containing protein [Nonomuraea angiospora]MBE1582159.1 alpha-glucosidase (family GH31 glycosyl hydrolase) [Nonomuraea angiospora]